MKKIKLDIPKVGWPLNEEEFPYLKQTYNNLGIWGDYKFYVNTSITECDYWIVFEEIENNMSCYCPRNNTIFITGEPPGIKKYDQKFLNQFSHIISCHKDIVHPDLYNYIQGHLWFVLKNYDELSSIKNINKTKDLSIITSNKVFSKGHKKRYEFALRIKEHFGDRIDLFGNGIKDFKDKWDALAPYRYSIIIENYQCNDWLTEKLFDSYLCHTFPLYYGCLNISKYFNKNSYLEINIDDFENTVKLIENLLDSTDHYNKNLNYILDAKNRTLNCYNLFPLIVNFIESKKMDSCGIKEKISLKKQEEIMPNSEKKRLFSKGLGKFSSIYFNLGNLKLQFSSPITRWFADQGDKTLRLNYNLNKDSIVFDLGGFKGEWSKDIFSRYGCNIFIFEPVSEFEKNIRLKFLKNEKIRIFNFGLAEKTKRTSISICNDASSIYIKNDSQEEEIILKKASDFFDENSISHIDLMKINIEGGEYDLLEHLIETKYVLLIDNIQVQFHNFLPGAENRMKRIQKELSKSHSLTFQYKFVWENWKLKNKI